MTIDFVDLTKLAFVDTETTGLDADRHEIWECALITSTPDGAKNESTWMFPVDVTKADPIALDIGGFHSRHPQGNSVPGDMTGLFVTEHLYSHLSCPQLKRVSSLTWAKQFASRTHGKHLVGMVPSFDEERLRKKMLALGVRPSWHYHLIDVEAMIVGRLASQGITVDLPWSSEKLSEAIGVPLDSPEDRHTALADARWAMRLYMKAMEPEPIIPPLPPTFTRCGSFGCTLWKGHNRGRPDIPENHRSDFYPGDVVSWNGKECQVVGVENGWVRVMTDNGICHFSPHGHKWPTFVKRPK